MRLYTFAVASSPGESMGTSLLLVVVSVDVQQLL